MWNLLGVVTPCNPNTPEVEAGLYKFKASLGYLVSSGDTYKQDPVSKKNKRQERGANMEPQWGTDQGKASTKL